MSTAPLLARRLVEQLEQAASLDPLGGRLQALVNEALPDGTARVLLEGRWLGHALHPMLSDVPIGPWTSSVILDLLGGPGAEGSGSADRRRPRRRASHRAQRLDRLEPHRSSVDCLA